MSTVPDKPKPGGLAFIIPVLLWVISVVIVIAGVVYGIGRITTTVEDFERVNPGAPETVTLDSGGQRIWVERPGADSDFSIPVQVTVTGPDGQEITPSPYIGDLDYSGIDGRDGTAVATFEAPTDGEYTIDAEIIDGRGGQLAIGKGNPVSAAAGGFVIGFLIGGVVFLIAVIVLIVMLVKRSGSKKRIRAAANAAAYGAPGQQGYGAPQGYGQPPQGYGAPPPQGYGTPPPPPPPPGGGWGGPPPPT